MSLTEGRIQASMIIEVIGRPAEHLVETLNDLIKKIGEEKGVEVTNTKINEPVLLKDQKDFYTSFAEIEIEVESPGEISLICFKYMPAHLEIISPEKVILKNADFNDMFNEVLRKLHGYDEVARIIQTEKKVLENKLKSLLEEKKTEENPTEKNSE